MSVNTTNPTNQSGGWLFVAVHVTSSLTFTIGFPTNLIIILLVSRRRNLKNPTNYFVSSLAVADVLVLLWMVMWLIGISNFGTHIFYKYISSSLDIFLGIASMLNVAAVSVDRAIAVVYPLSYEKIVTGRRSFFVIAACWMYSIIILIAALLRTNVNCKTYDDVVLYIGFSSYFIPVSLIIVCYTLIFLVILPKLKEIRELEKVIANARHIFSGASTKKKLGRRKLFRELKVTGNVLVIVIPFTVGWTFLIGTHLYEETKMKISDNAHNFTMIIIPWILSGLNPILYLMLNRSLRQAFLDVVRKCCKSNNYSFDDSRTSFFITLTRRASSAFRRASTSVDEGFLSVPKLFVRRRDSKLSNARQSRSSSDATVYRETEVRLSRSSEDDGFAQTSLL